MSMRRSTVWNVSMRFLESKIAWRYLFSHKGHNAINIVTAISAVAVGVVAAAMVCVLSVMNGFGCLVESMFSDFDPELKIVSSASQPFSDPFLSSSGREQFPSLTYSRVLSGQALIEYRDHRLPCMLMGVDTCFQDVSSIDDIICDGSYSVYDGAFDRSVMGRGLAAELGVNAHFVGAIHVYAPRRTAHVNMLRPDDAFHHAITFISGCFAVGQVDYDDRYMLVSLPLAQSLFDYDSTFVSALHVSVPPSYSTRAYQRQLQSFLGDDYRVLNRYEQQADFYRILRVEKWLTAVLLVFILLIASFNIVGSLSMLIIDKEEDIRILSHLGLSPDRICLLFLYEGWIVSSLGAVAGIVVGLALCLSQEWFGWLTLGNGSDYVVSAYPVVVQWGDVCWVAMSVLCVGWVAAWFPSRNIKV